MYACMYVDINAACRCIHVDMIILDFLTATILFLQCSVHEHPLEWSFLQARMFWSQSSQPHECHAREYGSYHQLQ